MPLMRSKDGSLALIYPSEERYSIAGLFTPGASRNTHVRSNDVSARTVARDIINARTFSSMFSNRHQSLLLVGLPAPFLSTRA